MDSTWVGLVGGGAVPHCFLIDELPNAVTPSQPPPSCFSLVVFVLSFSPSFLWVCISGEEVEIGGGTADPGGWKEGGAAFAAL